MSSRPSGNVVCRSNHLINLYPKYSQTFYLWFTSQEIKKTLLIRASQRAPCQLDFNRYLNNKKRSAAYLSFRAEFLQSRILLLLLIRLADTQICDISMMNIKDLRCAIDKSDRTL